MTDTADVIVIGAGVQGASLAFHLASRGASVIVLEQATAASGATGRSSGLVRVYYDLLAEAKLAWESHGWFADWEARVGGDCGFTRTGFIWIEPAERLERVRANSASHRAMGVDSAVLDADGIRALFPALDVTDEVAAYEPDSGYADPFMTAAGFLSAAKQKGARLVPGARVIGHPHGRRPGRGRGHEPRQRRRTGRSSTPPAPGRAASPRSSTSTSRSRSGAMTPATSACRRASPARSRSSSTTPTACTSGPRARTWC